MKVRLLRDARVTVKAGEVVEISPAEARFLLGVGSAVKVEEAQKEPAKKTAKKK